MTAISDLRRDYTAGVLRRQELDPNPFAQFQSWFNQAVNIQTVAEPNAMNLATVDLSGQPCSRMVLLKGLDERGLIFFTNYGSRKGRELAGNKKAALLFFWAELERQIGIRGRVQKLPAEESDRYFHSRPRSSQLAAWSSEQSGEVEGRQILEERLKEVMVRFAEGDVPRPEFWGGFILVPSEFEFWQGRQSRLHDRFLYTSTEDGWQLVRLQP